MALTADQNAQLDTMKNQLLGASQTLSSMKPTTTIPTTINSNAMSAPTTTFQNPNPTPVYPVASLDTAFQMTPEQTQANDYSKQLQTLNNSLLGESAYSTQMQDQYGIPKLNSTITDLTSQMNALKNEASAIPMQIQNDYLGRGATDAGVAPIQDDALRRNAIKALSVNSLLNAANGNLSTAMDMADRATRQRFDPIREQINATQANLQAIQNSPAYSLAEKKQAAQQQMVLAQQSRTLDSQEENHKTTQAMAAAAVKLNPNDRSAVMAAQQALNLDPSDPQYLSKVYQLLATYQSDPIAVQDALLQQQLKQQQLTQGAASFALDQKIKNAQLYKTNLDIKSAQDGGKLLSVTEAKALGVPYGITQAQAMSLGKVPGAAAATNNDASSAVGLVNEILNSGNTWQVGKASWLNPLNAMSGSVSYTKNQLQQLSAMLALENRSKLKGQGQISDYEGRILNSAASALGVSQSGFSEGTSNLDPITLQRELKKVRGVISTMNGGVATVTITDPKTGESQTVQATSDNLSQAAKDGMKIEFQ